MLLKLILVLGVQLGDISTLFDILLPCRWSAYVVDGTVKALNIEEAPSDFKVTGADVILNQI